MNRTKMDTAAIEAALRLLNASAGTPWELVDGKLHKDFQFRNFVEAFGFMTRDWDGKIRMDPSSPYAMARLVGMRAEPMDRLRDDLLAAAGLADDEHGHG